MYFTSVRTWPGCSSACDLAAKERRGGTPPWVWILVPPELLDPEPGRRHPVRSRRPGK